MTAMTWTWTTDHIAPFEAMRVIEADGSYTVILDTGLSPDQVRKAVRRIEQRPLRLPRRRRGAA
jgi:hypothetical protein